MEAHRLMTTSGTACFAVRCAFDRIVVGLALLLVALPHADAQFLGIGKTTSENDISAKLERRGDLQLRDTRLSQALFTISQLWKVNIVIGDNIEGDVNAVFEDTSLTEILDAVLMANGYSYRQVGKSLIVVRMEELGDVNPMFKTATIAIAGGDPTEVVEAAKLLNSKSGQVRAIPSARSLLVIDYPERVAEVRKFVAGVELAN